MLDPTATRIVDWLREIGLTVRISPLGTDTFLPGVTLEPGGLIVDLIGLADPLADYETQVGDMGARHESFYGGTLAAVLV